MDKKCKKKQAKRISLNWLYQIVAFRCKRQMMMAKVHRLKLRINRLMIRRKLTESIDTIKVDKIRGHLGPASLCRVQRRWLKLRFLGMEIL